MGVTRQELNEMDVDAVIELVRSVQEEQGDEDETPSDHLSARELEDLPSHPATDEDGSGECVVCLEAVCSGQQVARLPCAHAFHHPCIVRWLARSRQCPYCRTELVPPLGCADEGGGAGGDA